MYLLKYSQINKIMLLITYVGVRIVDAICVGRIIEQVKSKSQAVEIEPKNFVRFKSWLHSGIFDRGYLNVTYFNISIFYFISRTIQSLCLIYVHSFFGISRMFYALVKWFLFFIFLWRMLFKLGLTITTTRTFFFVF